MSVKRYVPKTMMTLQGESQVVYIQSFPPSQLPPNAPIAAGFVGLKLTMANGEVRWFGVTSATIDSTLSMVVEGETSAIESWPTVESIRKAEKIGLMEDGYFDPTHLPTPEQAWLYAATWGDGGGGSCMYGFDELGRPQSEEHRQDCLDEIERDIAYAETQDDMKDLEVKRLKRLAEYLKSAPLMEEDSPSVHLVAH